jgi:hypothetical protein
MAESEESAATRIVFAGGAEVTVAGAAEEIERILSRGSRSDLAHFKKADGHGGAVYVSAAQVAYVEQIAGG